MTETKALSFDTLTRLAIEAGLMEPRDTMSNLPAEYAGSICIFAELVAAEVRKKVTAAPQPGYVLVPVEPEQKYLRPFHSCPPDELGLAWSAMVTVARVAAQARAMVAEMDMHDAVLAGIDAEQAAPQQAAPNAPDELMRDLKNAIDQATELRQQLTLMEEHARGEVWRWQADGADDLATMGNRMGVLIYASDLRALIEAPQQAAPAGWWRKRADEIEAQVAMTGSPEAMRCFTDMRTLLQAATEAAPQQEVQAVDDLAKELDTAREALQWYMRRCEQLQHVQHRMRDPERTMACDILANGSLLAPEGQRYTAQPAPSGDAELLDFICNHDRLRMVEQSGGFWRVYQDESPWEAENHLWQSMTSRWYPTAREAIKAARDKLEAIESAQPQPDPFAAQPAPSGDAEQTYEHRYAIRQGHEISASNAYFEARPQIDSNDRRKVFQAGFERGWDAARKEGPTNV